MSRQNKNTRNRVLAAQFTKIHKSGGKGPAKTAPKHNKVHRQPRNTKSVRSGSKRRSAYESDEG